MASFTAKFNVAAADIEDLDAGASWTALDSTDVIDGAITIAKNRAGCPNSGRSAVAWYKAAVPTTASQEAGIRASSSAESSVAYVNVGVLGKSTTSSLSAAKLGIWATFYWLSSGARRIAIFRNLPDDSGSAVVAQEDLVLAGGIEAEGFYGVLDQGGALGVPQLIRIVVTPTDTGHLARVFINTAGDEKPVLEGVIDGDFTGTGDATQTYGKWWFGFGPYVGTGHSITVAYAYGLDYDQSEDHVLQERRPDQITLSDLRTQVRIRYSRGSATSLDDTVIDDAVQKSIDGLIAELGLSASFLWRTTTVDLDPDVNTCRVTLQAVMKEVTAIRDAASGAPMGWQLVAYSTNGAPIIEFQGSADSYLVDYVMRHQMPTKATDLCPIPREHSEAVVLGACYRIAFGEPRIDLGQALYAEYQMGFNRLFGAMARQINMTRPVVGARMFPQGYGLQNPWSRL